MRDHVILIEPKRTNERECSQGSVSEIPQSQNFKFNWLSFDQIRKCSNHQKYVVDEFKKTFYIENSSLQSSVFPPWLHQRADTYLHVFIIKYENDYIHMSVAWKQPEYIGEARETHLLQVPIVDFIHCFCCQTTFSSRTGECDDLQRVSCKL